MTRDEYIFEICLWLEMSLNKYSDKITNGHINSMVFNVVGVVRVTNPIENVSHMFLIQLQYFHEYRPHRSHRLH